MGRVYTDLSELVRNWHRMTPSVKEKILDVDRRG
jgi:hypothetical protein